MKAGGYSKSLLLGVRVYHNTVIRRDPNNDERKFYETINDVRQQYVILWKNNKLYSVTRDGKETEIIYAHFFRRKFVAIKNQNRTYFKIVPGKIIESDSICDGDFNEQEVKFYKFKYKLSKLKNSLKRYGLIKSIKRQKWTKDYNKYHDELRRKYLS